MTAMVVHKKPTRGRYDMLNTFCLFVLHILIATIVRENVKFNGICFILVPLGYYYKIQSDILANLLGRCPPRVASSDTMWSYGELVNKMVTSFD